MTNESTKRKCSHCPHTATYTYRLEHLCDECAQRTLEKVMALGLEFISSEKEIKDILNKTMKKL